jgi:septal ring factor EnvC (AmiA/AmiB activator)
MKRKLGISLLGLFVLIGCVWISRTVSSQGTIAPGTVRMSNQAEIEKRLAALEADNAQLKKDVAGLKLMLGGLDKSVTKLSADYGKHTHRIQAASGEISQIQGDASKRPQLIYKTLAQMQTDKGFFTSEPLTKP